MPEMPRASLPAVVTDFELVSQGDGTATFTVTVVDPAELSAREYSGSTGDLSTTERSCSPLIQARALAMSAARIGDRWAALTDDELASLLRWADEAAEWTPEDRQLETTASDQAMLRELLAELERRRSDG